MKVLWRLKVFHFLDILHNVGGVAIGLPQSRCGYFVDILHNVGGVAIQVWIFCVEILSRCGYFVEIMHNVGGASVYFIMLMMMMTKHIHTYLPFVQCESFVAPESLPFFGNFALCWWGGNRIAAIQVWIFCGYFA